MTEPQRESAGITRARPNNRERANPASAPAGHVQLPLASPAAGIALATQYGHLRASTVTDGYSGQARQGLRRVLDIGTAQAMPDYLDNLADRVNTGEGVSGPAAHRMIKAAADARVRFEGMFLDPPSKPTRFWTNRSSTSTTTLTPF